MEGVMLWRWLSGVVMSLLEGFGVKLGAFEVHVALGFVEAFWEE